MDKIIQKDIFLTICEFLDVHDIYNLNCSCVLINNILDDHLHQLYHKCTKEIEAEWNKYANIFINDSYKNHNNPERLLEYEQKFYIKCSVIPQKYHDLKVKYTILRDLNRLSWYQNDILMGSSLL
jgi:hypothetical protein